LGDLIRIRNTATLQKTQVGKVAIIFLLALLFRAMLPLQNFRGNLTIIFEVGRGREEATTLLLFMTFVKFGKWSFVLKVLLQVLGAETPFAII